MIYDGDCPLCSAYVTRLRLIECAGSLELVDAREQPALVTKFAAEGVSLDDGMVVQLGDRHYYGAEAVSIFALMNSQAGWFNRVNYRVFRSRGLSRMLYPALVSGRRLLLWLLGRLPLQ